MKEFDVADVLNLDMTLKEFEIMEDVLSEIREFREYNDEDSIALDSIAEYFSFHNYLRYKRILGLAP